MYTNQYLIEDFNKKYGWNLRFYDMDIVLTYVTLVPLLNRELGTNFVVEDKYKEQAEKIKTYKRVYGNGYHEPQRVTLLKKRLYEDLWELNTFTGGCPTTYGSDWSKERLLDFYNALRSTLSAHPKLFLESFRNIMLDDPRFCWNYNSIMQRAIDHYKPFLEHDEMLEVIVESCNVVMKNIDFRGFDLHY